MTNQHKAQRICFSIYVENPSPVSSGNVTVIAAVAAEDVLVVPAQQNRHPCTIVKRQDVILPYAEIYLDRVAWWRTAKHPSRGKGRTEQTRFIRLRLPVTTPINHNNQPQQTNTSSFRRAKTTAGPGWYTPHQTKPAVMSSSSSSMFRSGTKRFARGAIAGAPGPAFYQPEPLGKKSFRWNANKQWL